MAKRITDGRELDVGQRVLVALGARAIAGVAAFAARAERRACSTSFPRSGSI